MIAAAVNVFVIEPRRYCVSGVASWPTAVSQPLAALLPADEPLELGGERLRR
jgi:hypothetical protein